MKKALFISGSLGLGHVGRDLEIAGALRKLRPEVEVSWMAESPASNMPAESRRKTSSRD
jgi:predicted glycosyltransferase